MIKLHAGDRFGDLTVVGPAPSSARYPRQRMWTCRCVCGKDIDVPATYLTHGNVTSCGCRRSAARKDVTGQRFGRLAAISPTGKIHNASAVWRWQCDCGNTVDAPLDSVLWGGRVSCGCEKVRTEKENVKRAIKAVPRVDGTNLASISSTVTPKNNTSGRKGVYWHKGTQKWCAVIGVQGKRIYLGYYAKIEDAIAAREQAEEQYYTPILKAHNRKK